MLRPTTIITRPNKASSFWPSTGFPNAAPATSPPTAGGAEDERAGPADRRAPGMAAKLRGIEGDGEGRRADRDMSRGHADGVDEQRHGEDRAAAADKVRGRDRPRTRPKRARGTAANISPARFSPPRFHGIRPSSLAMPHQPVTPANTARRRRTPRQARKAGAFPDAEDTPSTTRLPAVIWTWRMISIGCRVSVRDWQPGLLPGVDTALHEHRRRSSPRPQGGAAFAAVRARSGNGR